MGPQHGFQRGQHLVLDEGGEDWLLILWDHSLKQCVQFSTKAIPCSLLKRLQCGGEYMRTGMCPGGILYD